MSRDFDITQHEMLTGHPFRQLANTINEGGGFSVKAFGHDRGRRATSGYMVGQPSQGHDFPSGDVHPRELEMYTVSKVDHLEKPDHFLGGWQGEDPVRASVDVAKRFPMGQAGSRSRAKMSAASSNQEAVGMVDAGGDYAGEIKNPNYVKDRGHGYRTPTVKDARWAFPTSAEQGRPRPSSPRQSRANGPLGPRGEGRPAGPVRRAQK